MSTDDLAQDCFSPSNQIYCDNEGVVKNSSRVDSTMNKKHFKVAYPFMRWNMAANVCKIAWINTNWNLADALTKRLSAVQSAETFIRRVDVLIT